ncbi:hypothetical protein EV144_107160 [Flavobacterium sp. 270]|uniref:hypothetical protein n=1 Tax=Flavobacterium sp. 270 TaxID=2512114 RepID=UPI001066F079|nr:hypothetical protein [Flavobacterium sp. 270]TDW45967.1 hypothetical protein EV144_107160 [Flavobacterium sp. 270]
MKRILLVMMLVLSIKNYSQVAVTSSYRGANEEFKKGELEKFKSTTTIFVLPQLNKKEDYEKMLKEVWTVTPYKIVDFKDFNIADYKDGTYSIAKIFGYLYSQGKDVTFKTDFTIRIFDKEKFDKGFNKLKPDDKKFNRKLNELFNENSINIARIPLSIKGKFLLDARDAVDYGDIYDRMYTEQNFTNTNLGMLKNYFQQINKIISKGEHFGLYDNLATPEIKNLKDNTLYIPEAYMLRFNPWKGTEKLRDEEDLKKIFQEYKYKYQFISDENLEKKIINNEEIFYLRHVRISGSKCLAVVNAKTGDPVYYIYDGGFEYNLEDSDFKNISKAISK